MLKLNEPIYNGYYKLNYYDAFSKIKAHFQNYNIIKFDETDGVILINAPYEHTVFTRKFWIKHIEIKLDSRGSNLTLIDIYGKPALLPHNLLRLPYFWKNKIDIVKFKEAFRKNFQDYEWKKLNGV